MRQAHAHWDGFDINLLRQPPGRRGSLAAAALVLALFVAGMAVTGWLWQDARRRTEAALGQLTELDRKLLQVQAHNRTVDDAAGSEALVAAAERLGQARPPVSGLLQGLNRLLPVEANLHSLTYENGRVQLGAAFASPEHVIQLLQRIGEARAFRLSSLGTLHNSPVPDAEGGAIGPDDPALPVFPAAGPDGGAAGTGEAFLPAAAGTVPETGDHRERTVLPVTSVMLDLDYLGQDGANGERDGTAGERNDAKSGRDGADGGRVEAAGEGDGAAE